MKRVPIQINHDKSGDVLYIVFGEPKPSFAETIGDGVYVRKDMDTDELRGITILDFSKRSTDELLHLFAAEGVLTGDMYKQTAEVLH